MRVAALLLVVLLVVPGCGSFASPTSNQLTYAQVQAFNPGVEGEWILSEYPFARDVVRRADGSICSMGFWVDDLVTAERYFDIANRMELEASIHSLAYSLFLIRTGQFSAAAAMATRAMEAISCLGTYSRMNMTPRRSPSRT